MPWGPVALLTSLVLRCYVTANRYSRINAHWGCVGVLWQGSEDLCVCVYACGFACVCVCRSRKKQRVGSEQNDANYTHMKIMPLGAQ